MKKFFLFLNTVRYLRLSQIFYRVIKIIKKPRASDSFKNIVNHKSHKWISFPLYDEKVNRDLEANFLNFTKKLNLPEDWNQEKPSKLWLYNLHYFDCLIEKNSKYKRDFHLKLIDIWIKDNPFGCGSGWDPYPTSLRITNILKAWLCGLDIDKRTFESLHIQANYLFENTERHLLGNHYFTNLKALLFAGIIFKEKPWLDLANSELLKELDEQVLEDGANFELSPMYHSIMLVDMLDMLNILNSYPEYSNRDLYIKINQLIPKMFKYMKSMSHPDGGVSFFNDSVNGIAPPNKIIEDYGKRLGFKNYVLDETRLTLIDNKNSGYIVGTLDSCKLIFDASPVGPDYIPGHAHADTLSFEFSIGKERVFVNSGVSHYEFDKKRIHQRKTVSHNTVQINKKDSSQVWSSFRVGKRAKITDRSCFINDKHEIYMNASHNGYSSFLNKCIHSRDIKLRNNSLDINDNIYGKFRSAIACFYFHPNLRVSFENNIIKVQGKSFVMTANLEKFSAKISNAIWSPEFGLEIPNKLLELNYSENINMLSFEMERF